MFLSQQRLKISIESLKKRYIESEILKLGTSKFIQFFTYRVSIGTHRQTDRQTLGPKKIIVCNDISPHFSDIFKHNEYKLECTTFKKMSQ